VQIQGPGAPAPALNVAGAARRLGTSSSAAAAAAPPPAAAAAPPPPPADDLPQLAALARALVSAAASGYTTPSSYLADAENLITRQGGGASGPPRRPDQAASAAVAFADGWAAAVLGRDLLTGQLPLGSDPPRLAQPVSVTVSPLVHMGQPQFDDLRAALAARVLNPVVDPPSADGAGAAAGGADGQQLPPATLTRLGEAFAALVASRLLSAEGAVRSVAKLFGNRRKRAGALALARGLLASSDATAPAGPLRDPRSAVAMRELAQAVEGKAAPAAAREMAAGGAGAQQAAAAAEDLRAIAAGLAQMGVRVQLPPGVAPPGGGAAAAGVNNAPAAAAPPAAAPAPAPPPAPPSLPPRGGNMVASALAATTATAATTTAAAAPRATASAPTTTPMPAAALAPVRAVRSVGALDCGHTKTVFTLAVDGGPGGTGAVASGGKDGIVAVWDGRELAELALLGARDPHTARERAAAARGGAVCTPHRFQMAGMFAISVDAHSGRRVLLTAWNGDEDHSEMSGAVTVTDLTPGGGYASVLSFFFHFFFRWAVGGKEGGGGRRLFFIFFRQTHLADTPPPPNSPPNPHQHKHQQQRHHRLQRDHHVRARLPPGRCLRHGRRPACARRRPGQRRARHGRRLRPFPPCRRRHLCGHDDLVSCLATIPGEPKLVASGGGDGRVRLWDCRLPPSSALVATRAGARTRSWCRAWTLQALCWRRARWTAPCACGTCAGRRARLEEAAARAAARLAC
jgi:hypothetical protein